MSLVLGDRLLRRGEGCGIGAWLKGWGWGDGAIDFPPLGVVTALQVDPGTAVAANAVLLAGKLGLAAAVYILVHLGLWWAVGRPDGVERTALDFAGRAAAAARARLSRAIGRG